MRGFAVALQSIVALESEAMAEVRKPHLEWHIGGAPKDMSRLSDPRTGNDGTKECAVRHS
jgi:hypothetical protein